MQRNQLTVLLLFRFFLPRFENSLERSFERTSKEIKEFKNCEIYIYILDLEEASKGFLLSTFFK